MQMLVPEIDVLIASSLWLWEREVYPLQFSIASGQGIDAEADRKKLEAELKAAGVPDQIREYAKEGPDVIGISRSSLFHTLTGETSNGAVAGEYWKIECKRSSGSKNDSVHRNHFDRGLASVVTYYEDPAINQFPGSNLCLGLALPESDPYKHQLQRVPKPLRQRLNLWILLYNKEDNSIRAVNPHDDFSQEER